MKKMFITIAGLTAVAIASAKLQSKYAWLNIVEQKCKDLVQKCKDKISKSESEGGEAPAEENEVKE